MLVEYVVKMYEKVVYRKTKEEVFREQKEEEERKKKEEEEIEEKKKEAAMLENECDEFTRILYEDVITLNRPPNAQAHSLHRNDESYLRAKRRTLYEQIQAQVITYVKHCNDMDMLFVLDQYGNENYKKDLEKNLINKAKITTYCDVVYVAKYFNLLQWWKLAGSQLFAEVSSAALVMLGKPTHNAFQERVFSRGTYKDSLLKKKLKEEKFEMSVLNSLNGDQVQELLDKGYYRINDDDNLDRKVDDFFRRSSGTQIIIDNDDIKNKTEDDSDSVSVNIDDNYAYLLESDNSDSDESEDETKDGVHKIATCDV
jgi:hypothetical protein